MAAGDLTVFQEFTLQLGEAKHNFSSNSFKLGIINNTAAPTAGDTTPTWGDYSANEVTAAGGYTAGGITLTSVTFAEVGGVATFDAANIALAQNGSGFTNAYWAIIYNDTEATDMAIAFIDLGGPVSEQAGPVNINFNASGIITITAS